MSKNRTWSEKELLVIFGLYCHIPFGKMHKGNPTIVDFAQYLDRTPSALAMKLVNIASLDPKITSTGRKGLGNASQADKKMWLEMQEDWESFAERIHSATQALTKGTNFNNQDDSDTSEIDYTGTDKIAQTKSRIGQSFFRQSVLSAYNYQCCISGLSIPRLLVASHIVPWRADQKNRRNPQNGLLLSSLHDKAFDCGIITITEKYTVLVSTKNLNPEDKFFESSIYRYNGLKINLPDKFIPKAEFLAYHRQHVFQQ